MKVSINNLVIESQILCICLNELNKKAEPLTMYNRYMALRKMEENKEWYLLVEGEYEDKGVFTNFYCKSKGIGEAIDLVKPLAIKEGIKHPKFIETDRIDNMEGFEYPDKLIKLSESVRMMQGLNLFDLNPNENFFTPPEGIIFSSKEGKYEIEQIKEQFVAYAKNENGIFEFELVVDANNLEHVFFLTTKFLSSIDGFWIWICNHWEEKERQLFVNKNLNELEQILKFLENNSINMIKNGFIDIVLHSKNGETNLTLNEHKKISMHTKSENVFNEFIGKVIGLGYEQTREMYDIEFGYHHWHYKPAKAFDRNEFCKFLLKNEFEEIENAM